jgi:hypothetical protein
MNFGLELAAGRIAGVRVDLAGLIAGGKTASQREALELAVPALLPERPSAETVRELGPMLGSPELARRLAEAKAGASSDAFDAVLDEDAADRRSMEEGAGGRARRDDGFDRGRGWLRERVGDRAPRAQALAPPTPLAEVAGLILGSPEFQRR